MQLDESGYGVPNNGALELDHLTSHQLCDQLNQCHISVNACFCIKWHSFRVCNYILVEASFGPCEIFNRAIV